MDGTEIIYRDCDGDDRKSRCIWNKAKSAIIEKIIKGNGKKEYTVTRHMDEKNDEMKLKVENENGVHCMRIFKREK